MVQRLAAILRRLQRNRQLLLRPSPCPINSASRVGRQLQLKRCIIIHPPSRHQAAPPPLDTPCPNPTFALFFAMSTTAMLRRNHPRRKVYCEYPAHEEALWPLTPCSTPQGPTCSASTAKRSSSAESTIPSSTTGTSPPKTPSPRSPKPEPTPSASSGT